MTDAQIQRNIRAATLLWMFALLLSRLMGFLREIIIARQVGATAETDVYFTAFTLPDFVNYLLAGGALSITFIPIFSRYLAEGRSEEGWRVFSIITGFLAVFLGGAILLAMIFADDLAPVMASGFTPDQQRTLARLTRILLPAQWFIFQGFLLSAVQMAQGQHRYAAMAPLIYNGGTIAGGLLLGPSMGMEGFAWGTLAGAIIGNFGLQVLAARKVGLSWHPTLALGHPGFREYLFLSAPIMVGQSLVVWDEWLTRHFGSFLTAASISWLNYGRKIAMVPQAVFGQATGYASYPHMARQAAEGKLAEVFNSVVLALRSVLVMSVGTQVLLMVLSWEVCQVLFRSDRFGSQDVEQTAAVLAVFSLGIAGWTAQAILARGFYAMKDTLTPTAIGTTLTVLSYPLYRVLSAHLGHLGLALASTVAISLYASLLFLVFKRKVLARTSHPDLLPMAAFLVKLLGVFVVSLGAAWGTRVLARSYGAFLIPSPPAGILWTPETVQAMSVAVAVSVVTPAIFLGGCFLVKVDGTAELLQRVGSRLSRLRR